MTLDPDCVRFLELMQDSPRAREAGAVAAREHIEAMMDAAETIAVPVHSAEDREIPGPAGSITLRVLRPSADPGLPVLVWFHGGGWATCSRRTHDWLLRPVANAVPCVVVIVEYRLAPEHPFPAAYEDCLATVQWLAGHAPEVGGDASRISIGGDSAGGNLAAAVALAARDAGIPLRLQVLIYPAVDDDVERPSMQANASGYGLERVDMEWYFDAYLPEPAMRTDWRALPMKATDVGGVAPALVITAEYDPLRDEGEAYAARLRDAGVAVTAHRYDGLVHGFFGQDLMIPAGASALTEVVDAVRAASAGADA